MIAEGITASGISGTDNWWDKTALVTYAHNTYPLLTPSEEGILYRFAREKFSNTLKSGKHWRFDGIMGDNLVFSAYIGDLPTAVLLKYHYTEVATKRQLKIVNWQIINHLSSGLDAYFAYKHNTEAIAQSDFIKVIKMAKSGGKMSEQAINTIFDKLPDSIKQQPTLLNDFIFASITILEQPSPASIDKWYRYAPPLTPKTAAFWGYDYAYKKQYQQYKLTRQRTLAYLNNLQTNFSLEGVLLGLEQKDIAFAHGAFMQYIEAQPHDALAYAIYLNRLIELDYHQQASHVLHAFKLQFNVQLTREDFSETDQQKVAAFFDSESFKRVSRL